MIAAGALLLFAAAAPGADWLLVRGSAERVGTLSYARIGDLYLAGAPYRIVGPGEAAGEPATSRLVVGSADVDPLALELAQALGVRRAGDALEYEGRHVAPGEGLVVRGPDPDGGGLLWLFTGPDAAGVFACFTAPLALDADGWAHFARGEILARGALALRVAAALPVVVRLDRQALWLADAADGEPDERALRVGRGLLGHAEAFARVGYRDLAVYGRWLLGPGAGEVARARAFFAERDLSAEVRAGWERCSAALSAPARAPSFQLLFAPAGGTNACTFDPDPVTGRPRVMLNLCALAAGRRFEAALLHESAHVAQGAPGDTLAARAAHEGVATALAQRLDPSLSDADALFWTEAELAAAEARRDALAALFRARAGSTDRALHAPLLTLGAAPPEVPGAPSRSGYWLAWSCARAWLEAHPGEAAGLLDVTPSELLAPLGR